VNKGILAAVVTYALWGVFPIYWKLLQTVPPLEILCHRAVWAFVLVLMLLAVTRQWAWLRRARNSPRTLIAFAGSACLLGLNWFTYIWAVNAGHIVDSSLGYFINPLVSVMLGVLFLGERLRSWQAVAIALAIMGVLFLALAHGVFPWIALVLAGTFGFYGLLRKTASLGSLEGLSLEMALLFLPALAYLAYLESASRASFGHAGIVTSVLLALTGAVTAFPLLMFTFAARKVTLATMGILQYIAPTLQFLLGVVVYHEPFAETRLIGFAVIWLALFIYSFEGAMEERKRRACALSVS
jgi:chloramphenicol-sensitive protein RarD